VKALGKAEDSLRAGPGRPHLEKSMGHVREASDAIESTRGIVATMPHDSSSHAPTRCRFWTRHRPLVGQPATGSSAVRAKASGGTSRYCSPNFAISANAGAATTPPQIAPRGSSTVTRITSLGSLAGT
jgi:hypothetical protein